MIQRPRCEANATGKKFGVHCNTPQNRSTVRRRFCVPSRTMVGDQAACEAVSVLGLLPRLAQQAPKGYKSDINEREALPALVNEPVPGPVVRCWGWANATATQAVGAGCARRRRGTPSHLGAWVISWTWCRALPKTCSPQHRTTVVSTHTTVVHQ